ncbi:MAG: hypothetical protein IJ809_04350 [Clostridia bacterium]|nr:hypothetical protein [Clostridia bacterium]
MSVVDMAKRIKDVHKSHVAIFKLGSFCKVFGKDAYVISSIFKYKVQMVDKNVAMSKFEIRKLNYAKKRLEAEKISYMILEPRNGYDVEKKIDFEESNMYEQKLIYGYSLNKRRNNISKVNKELVYFIDKPNFRKVIKEILLVCEKNKEDSKEECKKEDIVNSE